MSYSSSCVKSEEKYKYLLCTAGENLSEDDRKHLLNKMHKKKGSNVIFLFDGYDECDPNDEGTVLVRDIFMKTDTAAAFEESIVIISSRPSATHDLREAYDKKSERRKNIELVNKERRKNVEIIGFSREEVYEICKWGRT